MGTWRSAVMVGLISVWSACGPAPAADGGVDAGGVVDAGSPDAGRDAGVSDAGAIDAGIPDAGDFDAGLPDAGDVDAGLLDAGDVDAGLLDAGEFDAGISDAGEFDAGVPDAGVDGGPVGDAGVFDAGGLDAGSVDGGLTDAGSDAGLGPRWHSYEPLLRPRPSVTWDPDGQRLLVFSGVYAETLTDFWSWNGTEWFEIRTDQWPEGRALHSVAYDASRHRLVLFGGWSQETGVSFLDTWEFDGLRWQQLSPAHAPTDSVGTAMVYDPLHQQLVLHDSTGVTWRWDGTDWTVLATGGPMDTNGVLAWDSARARAVFFGARNLQTWEWDGLVWTQRAPVTSPSLVFQFSRYELALAWDGNRQRTVLVVGEYPYSSAGNWPATATWEWDGTTWTNVTPLDGTPTAGNAFDMVWDPVHAQLLLFGGNEGGRGAGELWLRTSSQQWSRWRPQEPGVVLRYAFDAERAEFVQFGGWGVRSDETIDETWVRSGRAWTQRLPAVKPSPRRWSSLGWDPVSQRVILFGGFKPDAGFLTDTWAWDGTNWASIPTTSGPAGGMYASVVLDAGVGRLLFVGGPNPNADLWEWTGSSWTQLPGTLPLNDRMMGAAWDGVRQRALFLAKGRFVEWDGVSPLPTDAGVIPGMSENWGLAWDPVRSRAVTAAQWTSNNREPRSVWEWDGQQWTETPLRPGPKKGCSGDLMWDPLEQRVLKYYSVDCWLEW